MSCNLNNLAPRGILKNAYKIKTIEDQFKIVFILVDQISSRPVELDFTSVGSGLCNPITSEV